MTKAQYTYLKLYLNKSKHRVLISWLLWERLDDSESAGRSIVRKLYRLMQVDPKWQSVQRKIQHQRQRNAAPPEKIAFDDIDILDKDRQASRCDD